MNITKEKHIMLSLWNACIAAENIGGSVILPTQNINEIMQAIAPEDLAKFKSRPVSGGWSEVRTEVPDV